MKRISLIVFVSVLTALTLDAQVVVKGSVDIQDANGSKSVLTDTVANKSWELVSGLYSGFQIGYITGNLTGTNAPFHISESGLVRIGTATIDNNAAMTIGGNLTVRGNLRIDSGFGIKINNAPFISRIGNSLVMGVNAGNVAMTGASNVFVGALSGQSTTSGNRNAYFGEGAGSANTTGVRNVYVGALSGNSSILGAENTFVGFQSGYEAEGSRNTFLGGMAGRYTINGTANTSVGYGAGGNSNSSTGENTFVGAYAGENAATTNRSVAIGFRAGSDVGGDRNVLIGYLAGAGDTNASNSLYIGNNTHDATGGALIYGRFDQGKVGINTTNLDAKSVLTVGGKTSTTGMYLHHESNNTAMHIESVNGKNPFISFKEQDQSGQAVWKGGISWNSVGNRMLFDSYDGGDIVLRNLSGGNVGIGVETPSEKLEVAGNVKGPDGESSIKGFKNILGRSTDGILHLRGGTSSGQVFVNHYETGDIIMANGGGDVGIGTLSPTAKLDVNGNAVFHGKIETTRVVVSTTPQGGWPDYVFEPEFKLRSLSEVEAFVKDNKHLPDVPSAKEVEANGIDLGNMDATLLKKVEELTLYMIEMNKKIEKLENENKQLKELVKKDK